MNILFISHCDFNGTSAMQVYSIANTLTELGLQCAVCVPHDPSTIELVGSPMFAVLSYSEAYATGVVFPDKRGPDLIHAWTPRELVRKLTEHLAKVYRCNYLVHLEDNEEIILESELDLEYDALLRLPSARLDAMVPEHRSHPLRYREFLAKAIGVTALIDRLLEFKPKDLPGLVFWPGFDTELLHYSRTTAESGYRFGAPDEDKILVYNGNIHETNAAEVRSLFLAVQALRRQNRRISILKTGWNHVAEQGWIQDAIESGAVIDLGFVRRSTQWSILAVADYLVQPGRADQFNDYRFPSKLPEFFASGRPVVLPRSNVGRSVRDGVEALVLEFGNAIEIAQKLELLMDDPELASRIGAAGKDFALRGLTWSKNVPPLRDFYSTLLAEPHSLAKTASADETGEPNTPVKLICFYLPQFHPIKENDEFWGKGFTEWTNVTRAQPNFGEHYQPQLPADLGFYDLRVPEVLEEQAQLAKKYGIYGFCFYYYWFAGRRLLERPLDSMLRSGRPDFPFCICWANENWTRNWDGAQEQILIAQDYSGDHCSRFIRDVIPIMQDPRYIRVEGAPVLLVYRVTQLPDPIDVVRRWREICAEAGIPKIHLCAVQSFGIDDPRPYGFDAAVEFPPHNQRALIDPISFPQINPDFEGYLEDYPTIVDNQLARPWPDYRLYRGVMPGWDNTPRRGAKAHILVDSSPEAYERWLAGMVRQTLDHAEQEPFLFINAWNEWAEGAYLEPDQRFAHARLQATRNALRQDSTPYQTISPNRTVLPDRAANVREPVLPLTNLARLYSCLPLRPLSYGTVRDYCDSFDNLFPLATGNGDLKDLQRPWMLKAILSKVKGKGRLLEIGAGEPIVAHLLQQLGHKVWIVDPYDGSGNGPTEFDRYRARYPHLKFVRAVFNETLNELKENSFDCIFSISVLEHVPPPALKRVFLGMRRFLRPDGLSIHAIDHVHRGNGAKEHLANLRCMLHWSGFQQEELDDLLAEMDADTDTYYLSAESHNRWRMGVPYAQFPMRVCVSIQTVSDAASLRVE